MHLRFCTFFIAVVCSLLACAGDAPVAPSAQPDPIPLASASDDQALAAFDGDQDGDGFAIPTDCLDSGALWAKGTAPCSETQAIVFAPSDGQAAKDFSLLQTGDGFHIFHIRGLGSWGSGDNETTFGHESSDDLLQWNYHPPIDLRGATGSWNDRNLWSPHVIALNGQWYMYYSGVSYGAQREYNLQRIGLCISSDLLQWTPAATQCDGVPGQGCLLDCEALWSSWGSGAAYTGDCRDPFVMPFEDGFVMFLTARRSDGKEVIARATSPDGLSWALLDYIASTAGSKAESPTVLFRNGNYELYFSASSGVHVATASHPLGSFGASTWAFYGFAAESLPAPGGTYWVPFVDGGVIDFQRLFWGSSDQRLFSKVVSPLCAIAASNIYPSEVDPPNGIDDNCDGFIDVVQIELPPGDREGPRPKLRFTESERGRF